MRLAQVNRRRFPHAVAFALGMAVAQGAAAAQWTTSAGLGTSVEYSDNVCLSDENKQDETYATVTPRAGISATGRRANLSLAASVTANTLSDSQLDDAGCGSRGTGERDNFFPRINGSAYAEVIEQWLYVDARVNVTQNDVDPFASGAGDTQDRNGNTNTTYRYTVSPYISRRFGDLASLLLRYNWNDQYNSKDVVGDSSGQSANFALNSVPGSARLSWGLQANYSETDYRGRSRRQGSQSDLSSAQLNLGFQFSRAWQINGFVGEEWNDFVSSSDEIDGTYWDAGIRWTPNSRTVVEAGSGDRFFGSSPRFSVQYRHKRSTLRFNYNKSLTYDRRLRALDTFVSEDAAEFLFDPETGQLLELASAPTTISNSPIVDERLQLAYSYQGRRSNFSVVASQSEQQRLEDVRDSRFTRIGLTLSRNLSRKWTATGAISWDERKPLGGPGNSLNQSETWRLRLSADRPINDWINFRLSYVHTDRQSERASQQYQENRLSASLRFTF